MDITKDQGRLLVRLAKGTIARHLGVVEVSEDLEDQLKDPVFKRKRGVFVTLHKDGQLRGCIGSLSSSMPLVEGIKDNAINAAARDPRFSPVSRDELDLIDVEVSILTEPKPLDYDDPDDLLKKLRPGVDGVIIKQGGASATFLPQVWKQLPNVEDFLSHLCQKAGLPHDQWQSGDLQVERYQVLCFAEKNQ